MSEWKEYKLGDIAVFSQGIQVGIEKQEETCREGYVRFIRIVDYTKGTDEPRYILYPGAKYMVDKTDIVMMRYGTPGKVARGYSGAIANNMFKITVNEEILNKDFAFYYLSQESVYRTLIASNSSSTMPAINFKIVERLNITTPSLSEQKRIVAILKCLDEKIENNSRVNENLEQQAQALFKSWFVDFEPFKDGEFVESDLGKTPKCLDTKYVSEIPHVLETGRRPKGGVGELTSGIPSVGAEHVKGMGKYDFSKTKYISEEYAAKLKTGKVKGYELLIYKDGGNPGYFIPNFTIFGEGYPFDECYLNEHVFKLDFDNRGYNIFCYFYFQTDHVMTYLNAQGGKAAIPGINRQDIENILIFSPENDQVKKFGVFAEPLFTKILYNCKESQKLATIRDTILPRLMSGDLKVDNINIHNL